MVVGGLRAAWRFAACLLVVGACGSKAKPLSSDGGGTDVAAGGDAPVERPATTATDAGPTEVQPDTAAVDGSPALEVSASSDAPASDLASERDASPDVAPSLAEVLIGDWKGYGQVGDCIDISTWYTFGADGSLVTRDIDDNACTKKPRLLARYSGTYALTGRVLEMTLDGIGQEAGYLEAHPKEKVTRWLERSPIALAVVPPPLVDAGHLALDRKAYTSADGAHFQSERYTLLGSATSDRIYEQRVQLAVTIDPPLPLAAGATCKVTVDFTLASFDAEATPATDNGAFRLEYVAIVRPAENGWVQLMAQKLDGVPSDKLYQTWLEILGETELSMRTPRFQRAFNANFWHSLSHAVDDPKILSGSLPTSGRWYESKPPLVQ